MTHSLVHFPPDMETAVAPGLQKDDAEPGCTDRKTGKESGRLNEKNKREDGSQEVWKKERKEGWKNERMKEK